MNAENKIGVALVKEACPLCGALQDGSIIMNTRLSENNAKRVEELHGKCLGYSKEPCSNCKELMSKGFLLIEVDEEKTEDHNNPWRTGKQWVITNEAANRIFIGMDMSKGAAFIPIEISQQLGLKIDDNEKMDSDGDQKS